MLIKIKMIRMKMSLKMAHTKDIKMLGFSKQFEVLKDKIQDQELLFMKMVSYSNLIVAHQIDNLNISIRISNFSFKTKITCQTCRAVDSNNK